MYRDSLGFHFMDLNSYETLTYTAGIPTPQWLKAEQHVDLLLTETGDFLACELPPFVYLTVSYTEPGYKGDTATKTLKQATMETGASLQVPLFINVGDLLKIDTRSGEYVERAAMCKQ